MATALGTSGSFSLTVHCLSMRAAIDHTNYSDLLVPKMSGYLVASTLASVFMVSCGQILFKLAAHDATFEGSTWRMAASWLTPAMIAALAISTLATVLWVWVLRSASLSVAYPLYALTFVLVPLMERLLFDTMLTPQHGLGAAAIIIGVWLMASAS